MSKLNPKLMLKEDFDTENFVYSPSSSSSKKDNSLPGKQGFLYRENDPQFVSNLLEFYQKVWVSLEDSKLLFSEPILQNISENLFLANEKARPCLGYLNLTSKTSVDIKYDDKLSNVSSSSTASRFPFQVKDEDTSITLCAETIELRDEWIDLIQEAIDGTQHVLLTTILMIPPLISPLDQLIGSQGSGNIDFPTKAGYLKKTTTGKGTLGIKTIKKRYFHLIGGELRYYDDEDIRPSKLKDTYILADGALVKEDNTTLIQIQLAAGRLLKLEADDKVLAKSWRQTIDETIALLSLHSKQQNGTSKARKLNIYDKLTDEQKKINEQSNRRRDSWLGSPQSMSRKNSISSTPSSPLPPPPTSPQSSPKPSTFSRFLSRSTSISNSPVNATSSPSLKDNFLHNSTYKSAGLIELLKTSLQDHFLLSNSSNVVPFVDAMVEKIVVPGEVIIWQGSTGDLFYVLEKGLCEVVKDNNYLSLIHEGKSFGELALLFNTTRKATIRARTSCRLWTLKRETCVQLMKQQKEEQMNERVNYLKQIEFFNKLLDDSLYKLAEVMYEKSYQTGEKIIKQGDHGDAFYMIAQGRVVVTQQQSFSSSSSAVELVRLGTGKSFGEKALLEDAPRFATVTATTHVTCYVIDRLHFLSIFGSMNSVVSESVALKMLHNVELLKTLSERQLVAIAKGLESKVYQPGDVIIQQGDPGDAFYMISSGEVSIHVNHIQVATLPSGAFFGEMALLSNEKRSATVTAIEETTCLILGRKEFNELLGPLDELIKAESKKRNDRANGLDKRSSFFGKLRSFSDTFFGGSPTGRDSTVMKNNNQIGFDSIQQFLKLKKITTGTFSSIYFVKHYQTEKTYLLKQCIKEQLYLSNTERMVFSERDILYSLSESSQVISLYATFQDTKNLYLIFQFLPYGDLFSLLYERSQVFGATNKCNGLQTKQAMFYFANALTIIDYIHEKDIIYRDIKPENFLIDINGYLKIIDFGSAKFLSLGDKTYTLCGSFEYIAPEMLVQNRGYDRSVDIWQLGVFLFELLTRTTPFHHDNQMMMFKSILESYETVRKIIDDPSLRGLDTQIKSMLSGLLCYSPGMRLGMRHRGIDDIWSSSVLNDYTREGIVKKTYTAPYVPQTIDNEDEKSSKTNKKTNNKSPISSKKQNNTNNVDLLDMLDSLDFLEDELEEEEDDEIPEYTGNYNYSGF